MQFEPFGGTHSKDDEEKSFQSFHQVLKIYYLNKRGSLEAVGFCLVAKTEQKRDF